MKLTIEINDDEIITYMQDLNVKKDVVQDALEEYFHAIIEDNADERADFVTAFLEDIPEEEDEVE